MAKKVVRTYKTKKGVVTKTYNYDKSAYTNKINKVITKKGTISKRIEKVIDAIEDVEEQEYIKRRVKQISKEILKGERDAHSYTLSNLQTMYQASRIELFLDNMGTSVQDIVNDLQMQGELDVNDVWVLDNSHWTFKKEFGALPTLRLPSGRVAVFEFFYQMGYEVVISEN